MCKKRCGPHFPGAGEKHRAHKDIELGMGLFTREVLSGEFSEGCCAVLGLAAQPSVLIREGQGRALEQWN